MHHQAIDAVVLVLRTQVADRSAQTLSCEQLRVNHAREQGAVCSPALDFCRFDLSLLQLILRARRHAEYLP